MVAVRGVQKKMLIAVLVLGVSSLVYWAVKVVGVTPEVSRDPEAPQVGQDSALLRASSGERVVGESVTPSASSSSSVAPTSGTSDSDASTASMQPAPPTTGGPNESKPDPVALAPGLEKALAEIKKIDAESELVKMHALLSTEAKDPNWSHAMEQQLNTFFLSRASQLGIEVPVIDCRASGCEVQLTSQLKPPLFNQLIAAARQESWFTSFDLLPILQGALGDRAFLLMVLKRR